MTRALFAVLSLCIGVCLLWLRIQSAPIDTIARGGSGPPTIVLIHGYGSRAEDWLQFEPSLGGSGEAGRWQFPAGARQVYPQAPWRGFGRRGWWWLDVGDHTPREGAWPDFSKASPGGLRDAASRIRTAIADEKAPLLLGGFSQGAMVAAEIAFDSDQHLDGLILLSGTPVNEAVWAEHFAGRRDLPIFIAHGRRDPVLSFAMMDRFQQRLRALGLDVTWYPFDGGHEISSDVIEHINTFVGRALRRDPVF